jgi:predicted TIM-barrel fold metal-dependent hydrolase
VTATATRIADCDVHCSVPAPESLYPYLPELWREHLSITRYKVPAAINEIYPPWNPAVRTVGAELTVERLTEEVLAGLEVAILQCYYGVESYTHPYLAGAMATAVNRWLQTEWLDKDARLRASAVVTPQYVDLAVEEIERIAEEPRFVQILVPARIAPGYGNHCYWPLWRAAAKHGLPVVIAWGGCTGAPPTTANWLGSHWEEYNTGILNFQAQVMSLVVSGVFQELPELKFVIAEGGWTWLPPFLWRLDQEWRAFQREVPWLGHKPPSAHMREHFRFTTQPFDAPASAEQLAQLIEQTRAPELLLFSSDYPHATNHGNDELLAALTPEHADRVRWSNAADWYGF